LDRRPRRDPGRDKME